MGPTSRLSWSARSTRARNECRLPGTRRDTTSDFDTITWTPLAAALGCNGAACVEARTGSVEWAPRRVASSGARVGPLSKTTTTLGRPASRSVNAEVAVSRESTTKVVAVTVRPAEDGRRSEMR